MTGHIEVEYFQGSSNKLVEKILLNIMFHAPMGRFQLELIFILPVFSQSSHPTVVWIFPVGLSSLIQPFQQVL